jgi:hypothetical protein
MGTEIIQKEEDFAHFEEFLIEVLNIEDFINGEILIFLEVLIQNQLDLIGHFAFTVYQQEDPL